MPDDTASWAGACFGLGVVSLGCAWILSQLLSGGLAFGLWLGGHALIGALSIRHPAVSRGNAQALGGAVVLWVLWSLVQAL